VVAATVAHHGQLDAVVHSAGVVTYGRVEDVPAEVFDGVLRTNLLGAANLARHVLPVLRRQQGGHLLLVGSVLGDIAAPFMTAYVVSKWGIRSLGRQLALENRDLSDVHVSVVSPGGVDTPIYESAANYLGLPGRPPPPVTTPERVAKAVLRVLDHPRDRRQVGFANNLMRAGFTLAPRVFDALVGPMFSVAALDRTRQAPAIPGSVLAPRGHALRGRLPNSATGMSRNVRTLARRRDRPALRG
jgi:NAD(P)-dependent dehydrogenase (short-subunit alcohol dehydrogenase family)